MGRQGRIAVKAWRVQLLKIVLVGQRPCQSFGGGLNVKNWGGTNSPATFNEHGHT
jgi:hypothetical protein